MFSATRWRRWLNIFVCVLLAVCVTVAPVSATVLKLNTQTTPGQIENFLISPDGQRVMYRLSNVTVPGVPYQIVELYSVPISGGTPIRLSSQMAFVSGGPGDQHYFRISPNGQRVAFLGIPAHLPAGDLTNYGLWSAPSDGSDIAVRLNGPNFPSQSVTSFEISPNGQHVIFRADLDVDNDFELYSVLIDGSAAATKLNKTLAIEGDVSTAFRITSDSSRVVYIADQDTNDVDELYSVPVAGSASSGVKLNGPLVANGDVGFGPTGSYFVISPNSERIVYLADQETDNLYELYSVLSDGSVPFIKLNGPVTGEGVWVYPDRISISPDSTKVMYIANQDSAIYRELYIVPIVGPASAGMKLSDPVRALTVQYAVFSPNGDQVMYMAGGSSHPYPLFVAPTLGPASSAVLVAGDIISWRFDANRIVYYNTNFELKSTPLNNPTASTPKLNPFFIGHPAYDISPDGTRVVFLNTLDATPRFDLYSVPITGAYTDSVTISGPLIANGSVELYGGFAFTPDGQRVVYRADAETDGKIELYVTDEGNVLNNRVYLPVVLR